jgi:hypothetical protein
MTDSKDTEAPSFAMAKIEVWLAGVLMILAFAVGFLLHGVTSEPAAPAVQQPISGLPPAGIVPAAPLTESQLQGGMPANHPAVAPGQTVPGAPVASPTKDKNGNGNGNNNP